jgi:hypothetical protein
MFGKFISKLFSFVFLACVLGILALAGYFWVKSSQPMQVDAAQRLAPGITFREFWDSQMEQWERWDMELRAVGKNGTCVSTAQTMFPLRVVLAAQYVAELRANRENPEITRQLMADNNGVVPPDNLLYEPAYLEAWWAMIEYSTWFQYASDPGGFPVKELDQRYACATTPPERLK